MESESKPWAVCERNAQNVKHSESSESKTADVTVIFDYIVAVKSSVSIEIRVGQQIEAMGRMGQDKWTFHGCSDGPLVTPSL